jgi:hypothetical protein
MGWGFEERVAIPSAGQVQANVEDHNLGGKMATMGVGGGVGIVRKLTM